MQCGAPRACSVAAVSFCHFFLALRESVEGASLRPKPLATWPRCNACHHSHRQFMGELTTQVRISEFSNCKTWYENERVCGMTLTSEFVA